MSFFGLNEQADLIGSLMVVLRAQSLMGCSVWSYVVNGWKWVHLTSIVYLMEDGSDEGRVSPSRDCMLEYYGVKWVTELGDWLDRGSLSLHDGSELGIWLDRG